MNLLALFYQIFSLLSYCTLVLLICITHMPNSFWIKNQFSCTFMTLSILFSPISITTFSHSTADVSTMQLSYMWQNQTQTPIYLNAKITHNYYHLLPVQKQFMYMSACAANKDMTSS